MSDEASPFGRYLIPPVERLLNVVLALALSLFAGAKLGPGDAVHILPVWDRALLLASVATLFIVSILAWAIPATTITPDGIQRVFARKRRVEWAEVSDFTVRRRWGVRRVYAQLTSGRKYILDGVPRSALDALRQQVGIGGAKSGSWWLVDYSTASSTSSS